MASPTATSPPTESKQSESVSHLSADILPVSDSSPTGDPSPPQPQQLQQNNSSLLQLAYNALGATGRGALRVIDAVGGELALVFGITVPKYDYVLYAYQDEQSKVLCVCWCLRLRQQAKRGRGKILRRRRDGREREFPRFSRRKVFCSGEDK